jgi:hypothetical protein
MLKTWLFLLIVLIAASGCIIYVPVSPERGSSYEGEYRGSRYQEERTWDELDVGYFYDYLEPWGHWVQHASHGFVWIPHSTSYNWRPYTQGKWLWSDYGWTWMSDISWGWACFHYGRWGYLSNLGWFWVPGTTWGPSWVAWRLSPSTIGWAPLPPDVRLDPRLGITSLPFALDDYAWVFVEYNRFYNTNLSRYVLPYERNLTFIRLSQLRTHISVRQDRIANLGLDPDELRNRTQTSITKYQLRQSQKAGRAEVRSEELFMYSPRVRSGATASPKLVVEDLEVQERRKLSSQPAQEKFVELQNQEFKNLEESQEKELERLEQQSRSEKSRAKTRVERERIDKELEGRSAKVQAQHKQEQDRIKKRHTEERKKISKTSMEKKKK